MTDTPPAHSKCPACGEPIQKNWKFCPACETSLVPLTCPRCSIPVKENWKLCPECECRLVCKTCGRRIPQGHLACPSCEGGISKSVEIQEVFIEYLIGIEFLWVPAGSFMMGDASNEGIENEKPVHEVRLDGFYMGKYPVTQKQWEILVPENPSCFKGDMLPVEQISRSDVNSFIQKLIESNHHKYTFQLPSEAQWEYAARSGGKEEMYSGGNTVDRVAWYCENSDGKTHPVGKKAPNGLGIYDMSGNVWEWCLDTFHEDAYRQHQPENPVCIDGKSVWVIRGGSWNTDAWSVRCSRRFSFSEEYTAPGLGFRLVMIP